MTERFLDRWSRLKRARGTEAELQPAREEVPAPAAAAQETEPSEAAEPLPDPEELGPTSDALAFLKPEIPEALRNQALRRLWSVDPAIRDFVGPAEYAWDFNKPAQMSGFGPLRAIDDVAELVDAARAR